MASGHGDEKEWVEVQKKTFTKWMNNHLRKKGYGTIEEVATAFEDGIKLMELINALYGVNIPKHNANPKMRPHKLDNLQLAFNMVEEAHIKTNFLKTHHLADHDLKMILGMAWAIILDYAIKGISVDESTAKEGLLLWVQKKTAGYRDVDPPGVQNFHTSWKNGMALCALIHRHRPNLIPYDELDKKNDAENLELAFSVAENHLGIPRLLDVEDLTSVARPDERSVMTYISEFFHRFASEDIKEQAARRVQKFVSFMRHIEEQQNQYESKARALIAWAQQQRATFEESKFGDTFDEAVAAMTAFRSYMVSEKPSKAADKLDLETLYAEIQTELLVNDRHPYQCPDDCTPDAVDASFEHLTNMEKVYGKAVRDNRFRFIKKVEYELPQSKIDEFTTAFNHFDKDSNGSLSKIEFKAALQALGVPFKDDAAFEKVFTEVSAGNDRISKEQYIQFNKNLAEDKDSPDQVKASFLLMSDQRDSIRDDQLTMPPLTDEEIAFLKQHIPKNDDGSYNFGAFVDSCFAHY